MTLADTRRIQILASPLAEFFAQHRLRSEKIHRYAFRQWVEDTTSELVLSLSRDGYETVADLVEKSIFYLARNYLVKYSSDHPFANTFIYRTNIEAALRPYGIYFAYCPENPAVSLFSVSEVGFDEHVTTRLLCNRLLSLEEVALLSDAELLRLRKIGPKTLVEIKNALDQYDGLLNYGYSTAL